MTEKQAWLWCAKKWDKAKADHRGWYEANGHAFGICPLLDEMLVDGEIGVVIYSQMKGSISARKPTNAAAKINREEDNSFRWGRTAADAKRRATFCRKMAASL